MLTLRTNSELDPGRENVEIEAVLRGSLKLVAISRWESSCVVTLRRESATGLTARERSVMERLIRGESQKAIAYELGVALTTVSAHLRVGLAKLGLRRWEQAVLAGAILERARHSVEVNPEDAAGLFLARAELCESALGVLTPAEREVALSVVDSGANREIAASRGVSQRTVANQIASVFRKLRVHGRLELIRRLVVPPIPPSVPLRLLVGEVAPTERAWPGHFARGSSGREPVLVGE